MALYSLRVRIADEPQPETSFVVSTSTSAAADSALNTLAFRMNLRNTVSVTPAIGASTVAGAIRTPPMRNSAGTSACCGMARSGSINVQPTVS